MKGPLGGLRGGGGRRRREDNTTMDLKEMKCGNFKCIS
jgi:hypothetical protein